jgi:hypothetical protein
MVVVVDNIDNNYFVLDSIVEVFDGEDDDDIVVRYYYYYYY